MSKVPPPRTIEPPPPVEDRELGPLVYIGFGTAAVGDQMSERWSTSPPEAWSGAMYGTRPFTTPTAVSGVKRSAAFATPRSITRA